LAVVIDGRWRIPPGIVDLASFRRWLRAEEPEGVRLAYLAGVLWVDQSMEQFYTHNQVKGEIARVLGNLVEESGLGRFGPDGMQLSNPDADLSTAPDGLYFTYDALRSGRIRQLAGRRPGVIELEGTPDMVLEVVSDSSVEKDLERLPDLYRRAGIPEFWRADARGELRFEILRLTEAGYVAAEAPDGWRRSEVFGRSFRLTQHADPLGQPKYRLELRA
jgi:Uma2 family endonuclease